MSRSIEDVYDRLVSIDKKLDLHILDTTHRLNVIASLDAEQNDQLAEHIKRTELLEKQFDTIQEPNKAVKFIIKTIMTTTGIIIALYGAYSGYINLLASIGSGIH